MMSTRGGASIQSPTLLPLLALLAGCSSGPLGPQEDDLEEARDRWALHETPGYQYVLQRSCFCGGDFIRPTRITVIGGEVTEATLVETGEPVSTPLDEVETIDDLFEVIEDAIDRDAFRLEATYDSQLGYPISVLIDYVENASDEEFAFEVSGFGDLLMALSTAQTSQPEHAEGRSPK